MFEFALPHATFEDEQKFTTRFGWNIKENNGFWFKIPDDSLGAKPYDGIACWCWESYHIELKVGKNKNTVDVFTMLRPVQKYSLRKVAENGWNAIVVYYSKFHHKYWVVPFNVDTEKLEIDLNN
jgi:hypothetical protein